MSGQGVTPQLDWARGDVTGLAFPTHVGALHAGGAEYLTRAFHESGALPRDNRIAAIAALTEWSGGATGRKAALTVRYATPDPDLPTELFVKFSRDFENPIRDRMRFEMRQEVRFAAVSRGAGFPIKVPLCLLAEFDDATGSGILLTERVPYGVAPIEPHYPKCMDYRMPDPAAHYRALIDAIATLAGSHRAGRLPAAVSRCFAFDRGAAIATNPMPRPDQIERRLERLRAFAAHYPQLTPAAIADPAFLARFAQEARLFARNAEAIARFLHDQPDFIALCHWNANVDNAWFWHEPAAEDAIACGLMDWGGVGQMSVAMTLWGCLSGAETQLWQDHLDDLIARFAQRYHACGGPLLDMAELNLHFRLYTAMMLLAWLLDTPAGLTRLELDLNGIADRFDPRFAAHETARTRLLMMTNVLDLWRRSDMPAHIAQALA